MTDLRNRVERIAREHAVLRETAKNIRAEIKRLQSETGPDHEPGKLAEMLRDFSPHLRRQFEFEERGGFLVEQSGLDAGTRLTLDRLLAQHRTLETELDALTENAKAAKTKRAGLPDPFVAGLQSFLDELLAHEREENALIQEIAIQETGTKD